MTVGIGHYMANLSEVLDIRSRVYLPQEAIDAGKKLVDVLAEDFNRLFGQNSGNRIAEAYEALTTARMTKSDGSIILHDDVGDVMRAAPDVFTAFSTFPAGAKLPILDIMFAGGTSVFKESWPEFTTAIANRDWLTASQQSDREAANDDRDAILRQWLRNAHHEERYWIDPGRL